jgi:hypothetical protein
VVLQESVGQGEFVNVKVSEARGGYLLANTV